MSSVSHTLSDLASSRSRQTSVDEEAAAPSSAGGLSSLAPFISKLFEMISKATDSDYIKWGPSGNTLIVTDPAAFARDVLPRYFKHDNIRSFVRQLNIYGFQRCRNTSAPGVEPSGELEFFHESFIEGREDLMINITRGVPSQKPFVAQKRSLPSSTQGAPPGYPNEASLLLREMYSVQDSIAEVGCLLSAQMSSVQGKMSKLTDALGMHLMAQPAPPDDLLAMCKRPDQVRPMSATCGGGGGAYGEQADAEVGDSSEYDPKGEMERSRSASQERIAAARLDLPTYPRSAAAGGVDPSELTQSLHHPSEASLPESGRPDEVAQILRRRPDE